MASLPVASRRAAPAPNARRLAFTAYDRRRLRPGIVHLGVGGFHRAHQAVYFDELARRGLSFDWGIVGVSLRRPLAKSALAPQDCLYTLIERGAIRERTRVIGSLMRVLHAPSESRSVLAALCDERTQLVTITVTGDGYGIDRATGSFDPGAAAPGRPESAHEYLVEALAARRAAGIAPFTVMSCDNLPDNGAAARAAVVGCAAVRDPELASWIEQAVAFPSSVVDRITPGATPADSAWMLQHYGVIDGAPIVTEPFSQWTVQDSFSGERPPLEEVGATFVEDVRPHKELKTRLLNGAHTALGPLGVLAGHVTIDAALADPAFAGFAEQLMRREIEPTVAAPAGVDVPTYRRTLLRRFANPAVADRLARLCERGSTKIASYLVPTACASDDAGGENALLALAIAGWIRFYRGVGACGQPHPIKDPRAQEMRALACRGDGTALLAERSVFGDLAERREFAQSVRRSLSDLDELGARGAIAAAADRSALAA
jgi:fructuronate reductase/mannitol 2-dehydrogenase